MQIEPFIVYGPEWQTCYVECATDAGVLNLARTGDGWVWSRALRTWFLNDHEAAAAVREAGWPANSKEEGGQ